MAGRGDGERSEPLAPAGYDELLEQLKQRVRSARVRAARAANVELLRLYWSIGRDILDRQGQAGWGSKVIDRLAADLRAAFPEYRGFSVRNLHYMRAVAAAWPTELEFLQTPAAELTWSHVTTLLSGVDDPQRRGWYAAKAVEHGWSRNVLSHQIATGLDRRVGAAPSNFAATLPVVDSELAQELTRDPYVFDHLGLTEQISERSLEQALMDKLQSTLTAFGHGMAFVGRQVRFTVGGDELVIDLLLFHLTQLRYVVVELKIGPFRPDYVGQLGTYVALIDDQVRVSGTHAATVGILLCSARNEQVVRYALSGSRSPMAVAGYTYEALPVEARAALPDAAHLQALLNETTAQVIAHEAAGDTDGRE